MSVSSLKSVVAEDSGERLDKFLARQNEISSRSQTAALFEAGLVTVNGKKAKASHVLKTGDKIQFEIPEAAPTELVAYDFPLEILHEDSDVLVVNKPSGLVVHPAAGHAQDTLVNALLAHTDDLAMGFGENRPGIVHRLDKETSGLLVIAKNNKAQENLSEQFQARNIHRVYQAVAFGNMPASGTVESYLARHPSDRKRYASVIGPEKSIQRQIEPVPAVGKWAITTYKTLAQKHGLSFVELRLKTGRTHQIRVHVSEMGHPLVGDALYGANDRRVKSVTSGSIREQIRGVTRFFLHARQLGFTHPTTGENLMFEKNWPDQELKLLREWGFQP